MEAWLPILGQSQEQSLFIDAFAGPGEYEGGEEGSPLIALRAFQEHKAYPRIKDRVLFKFIEKDEYRAKHLDSLLRDRRYVPSPDIEIINSTFGVTLTSVLDRLKLNGESLAPSFTMIDPFGFSDTPMELIGRILQFPMSEVYVSFMYSFINRFDEHPDLESHFDSLFGCGDWKPLAQIPDPEERKQAIYSLYAHQLRKAGAKYVLHFELYEGQRLEYAIFFGTKNLIGSDRMKQAVWKVAPFGDFRFRGASVGQLVLGDGLADFSMLQKELRQEFGSEQWTPIKAVEDFVMSDRTGFHSGHLRQHALIPMEKMGELEVNTRLGKVGSTYPDGSQIRFTPPEAHFRQLSF